MCLSVIMNPRKCGCLGPLGVLRHGKNIPGYTYDSNQHLILIDKFQCTKPVLNLT